MIFKKSIDARYFGIPSWVHDPLIEEVTRFAAARSCVGMTAIMRRFGVGRERAKLLMWALDERRILLSYLKGWQVATVSPMAWPTLYGCGRVDYVTMPGETLEGIAHRELGDPRRWSEISDINWGAHPGTKLWDRFPPGTTISIPAR